MIKNLKLVIFSILLCISLQASADSVGINYSGTQVNTSGTVAKGTWEVTGSLDLTKEVALTAKGILANNHSTEGYGTGIELGAKVKLNDYFWVQPALTASSPETGSNSIGYVVDTGVDIKHHALTFTPMYSYADNFQSGNGYQQTLGAKVSYDLGNKFSPYIRARHEFNEDALDANRIYIGIDYRL